MITALPDSECDWIEITDTETSGVITFNVLKNETDAKRESKITVTYEYSGGDPQSFSVNVSQDSGENNPDPEKIIQTRIQTRIQTQILTQILIQEKMYSPSL